MAAASCPVVTPFKDSEESEEQQGNNASAQRSIESKSGKAVGSSRGRVSRKLLLAQSARSTRSLDKYLLGGSEASKCTFEASPDKDNGAKENLLNEVHDSRRTAPEFKDLEEGKAQPLCPSNVLSESLFSLGNLSGRGRPRCLSRTSHGDRSEVSCSTRECVSAATDNVSMECNLLESTESANTSKKGLKRKRSLFRYPLDVDAKTNFVKQFRSEIAGLMKYYHEDGKLYLALDNGKVYGASGNLLRAEIAVLLEESELPFSTLVQQIFEKLRVKNYEGGGSDLTLANLRSTVLSIGERICFGIGRADADVLEDDSESCLWCWEVRDMKWLPEAHRDNIAIRRRRRRKISERVAALSAVIMALTMDHMQEVEHVLVKAEAALARTENETSIRSAVTHWLQKKDGKQMAKEGQQQHPDREYELECKHSDKEAEKKRLQQEKELKRQQGEAEKEHKRKEKEVTELKRQAALQKQATIMDRFLQSKKEPFHFGYPEQDMGDTCQTPRGELVLEVSTKMDQELGDCQDKKLEDFQRSHAKAWQKLGHQYTSRKLQRWGSRRLPKMVVFKELRLVQGGSGNSVHEAVSVHAQPKTGIIPDLGSKCSCQQLEDDVLRSDKTDLEWEAGFTPGNESLSQDARIDAYNDTRFHKRRKLLQFDRSYRPAYYGTFSKNSVTVRPRNPFRKDPSLDYENDSDEEWEEDDPGESLSDCDKDEEDDKVDVEDEDENADGFVVPDGYLSENEGVHLEDAEHGDEEMSACQKSEKIMNCQPTEDLQIYVRQQRILENVTEQALRSNCVYIINNTDQGSIPSSMNRTERFCLQALRLCVFTPNISIEPPLEDIQQEKINQDTRQCKRIKKTKAVLSDLALSEMVQVLLSSSQGLEKTIDIISRKIPSLSRSQLRSKVREISEFVHNHWQVKKEVLEQLGLKISTTKVIPDLVVKSSVAGIKPITTFFSKRCLPPTEEAASSDGSPVGNGKPKTCTTTHGMADGTANKD